jgi:spore germination protein YaaH
MTVAVALLTSVLPISSASATTALPAAGTLPVTAYQEEGDAQSLIDASASALGSVGVDGVNINSRGTSVPRPDSTATAQLAHAHALGLPANFLVGNYSAAISDFDETAAYRLLSSTTNINNVVATLSGAVSSQGWDGVTVDLESLQARDSTGLTNFVTALKHALPAGKQVSIDITTFTTLAEFRDNGYDLAALGSAVDNFALMAYDEHGFGDSGPGPVGELSWQENGLNLVLSKVPANKVDLGVAGYGYAWAPDGTVTQVSDQGARDKVSAAGATATFDTTAGEWTATLPDGTILWWSDARSFALRRTLAANKGIHGLAMWDLGLSDPITR